MAWIEKVIVGKDTCSLYYKCFTIVIYARNDSGQYYKTTITIIIDNHNW
jgi:hypothetical protein